MGIYKAIVRELMTPYESRWMHKTTRCKEKTNTAEGEQRIRPSLLQFTALHSDEQMDKVEYRIDLPESNATVLCMCHLLLELSEAVRDHSLNRLISPYPQQLN